MFHNVKAAHHPMKTMKISMNFTQWQRTIRRTRWHRRKKNHLETSLNIQKTEKKTHQSNAFVFLSSLCFSLLKRFHRNKRRKSLFTCLTMIKATICSIKNLFVFFFILTRNLHGDTNKSQFDQHNSIKSLVRKKKLKLNQCITNEANVSTGSLPFQKE